MKKAVSIILIAILIMLEIPICVFAAGTTWNISPSAAKIYRDGTVNITFAIEGNSESVGSAQFALFYDSEAFTYVDGSCASDYFTDCEPRVSDDSTLRFSPFGGKSTAAKGAIARVTFRPTSKAQLNKAYQFGIGSKGRTRLLVTSNNGFDGDIIEGPDSSEGIIVKTTTVTIIEKKKYTVTYTDGVDGITVFADKSFTAEENTKTPSYSGTPKRDGYTFAGWSPAVASKVTGNVTYKATWTKNATPPPVKYYTVVYTDGTGTESYFPDQSYRVQEGNAAPGFSGTPEREGYTFEGWSNSDLSEITEDTTFEAIWKLKTYEIVYTDGTGNESIFPNQRFTISDGQEIPEFSGVPKRTGYIFMGWTHSDLTKITEDTTFEAIWAEKICRVIYTDGTGEESIFPDQSYEFQEGQPVPEFSGIPEREGYNFIKWAPMEGQADDDIFKYIPVWEEIIVPVTFTVTYTDGVPDTVIFKDQEYVVESGNATPGFRGMPKREGYEFAGWNPEVSETAEANVTYTAIWKRAEVHDKGFIHFCFWFIIAVMEFIVIIILIIVKKKKKDGEKESEN